MEGTEWSIEEVRRLKKKELFQHNLVMLLVFLLLVYLVERGSSTLFFVGLHVVIWIIGAVSLYQLITDRSVGTKTSRRLQKYERSRLGEKRWKRRNIIGTVIILAIAVVSTIIWFNNQDINSIRLEFPYYTYPLVGVWIGHNIGSAFRIITFESSG